MEWSQAVSANTDGQIVNQPIEYCFYGLIGGRFV